MEFRHNLRVFYDQHFPFDEMYNWLSYGSPDEFLRREWSFSLSDAYIRYQSFADAAAWKARVMELIPDKMDIGARFNVPANQKKTAPLFFAESKEFVIDIDITDYDNVRVCGCRDAAFCSKCWPLMNCAMVVLSLLLPKVFGARSLLWVYSGRRGIHCWVCDRHFVGMDTAGRSAVAEFLNIYSGGREGIRQLNLDLSDRMHPDFSAGSDVFRVCEDYFISQFVDVMGLLDEHLDFFINELVGRVGSEERFLEELRTRLERKVDAEAQVKWEEAKKVFSKHKKRSMGLEIVYSCVFPRLDINVSKHLNHLLKSPFVVHPGTGFVCVPISNVKTFLPANETPRMARLVMGDERDVELFRKAKRTLRNFVQTLNREDDSIL